MTSRVELAFSSFSSLITQLFGWVQPPERWSFRKSVGQSDQDAGDLEKGEDIMRQGGSLREGGG